jgi:tRNA threonylcarbamoyladenosine biosynthesis protein TsaB
MNILAIDTASSVLSAALAAPGGVRYASADMGPRHSEILMDMLQTLIDAGGCRREDLDMVACMRGPGSFTGLRIGFSAAKGIALGLGIPMVTVPTLDCMAAPFSVWPGIVIPVMDAKKGCFFSALYRGGKKLSDYMDADPASIAGAIAAAGESGPVLLTGPDAEMLLPELTGLVNPDRLSLDPSRRKGWALELFEFSRKDSILNGMGGISLEGPLYIRKSDAELRREFPAKMGG